MVLRVDNFRTALKQDGARPNLFNCQISFPFQRDLPIQTDQSGLRSQFTFMARASQLPGSTVNYVSQFYFGRELKFAGNRSFPEWTVTVVNDENFAIRDRLEKWMSGLNSHVENLRDSGFTGPTQYQGDGSITQYGKQGNVLKKYKFIGMFPIDISPIEVDWGSNDTIEEYAVTFAYQWWEWEDGQNGQTTDLSQYNQQL